MGSVELGLVLELLQHSNFVSQQQQIRFLVELAICMCVAVLLKSGDAADGRCNNLATYQSARGAGRKGLVIMSKGKAAGWQGYGEEC